MPDQSICQPIRRDLIRAELRKLGYEVNVDVKDARHYGVPQRRRRLILLAALGAEIPFANRAKCKRTVRSAFKKLSMRWAKNDSLHNLEENRSSKVQDIIRRIPKNGGSRSDLGESQQLKCHQKLDGFHDVYGRMAWDEVSPTITGGCCNPSKGRFLHPTKNRTITLREAALLQGLRNEFC